MTTSFSPPTRQVPLMTKLTVIAAVVLVATLGGLATDIGAWYLSLIQPWWKPPDWAFGPAWTIIFACTAISAMGAWHASMRSRDRYAVGLGFAVNAFLNILWSVLFFKLQKPLWAALEVFALWASIAWLMLRIRGLNPSAARWLLPYLIWVSYAASINWGVVWLNPNQAHEQTPSSATAPKASVAPQAPSAKPTSAAPQTPSAAPQAPSAANISTLKPEPKP
ncbi:MAG: TspO/MBR family protein [Burkholderiaceae bacterium]